MLYNGKKLKGEMLMKNQVYINGNAVDTNQIEKQDLNEVNIKKLLKDGFGIMITAHKILVGRSEFRLGTLEIDNSCNVVVNEEEIIATVLYPYEEYSKLAEEENTKVVSKNGLKFVQADAKIYKNDIFIANAYKLPK